MSGSSYLYLNGRLQRPVVGSPEWNAAFPNGAQSVSTPLPPGTDLGKGYIPEATERGAPVRRKYLQLYMRSKGLPS